MAITLGTGAACVNGLAWLILALICHGDTVPLSSLLRHAVSFLKWGRSGLPHRVYNSPRGALRGPGSRCCPFLLPPPHFVSLDSKTDVSRDISNILNGWDFDPERVSVRIVAGEDGREKIQLRLDLGLLQMEIDGRPDGHHPEGCDSWLEFYRRAQQSHDSAHPDSAPFALSEDDCERLLREGVQYYHRYLSFWHLERYELCARDTRRNLILFKFVRDHAKNDRDRLRFDQWRPYVTMMHSRAVATPFVELGDFPTAVTAIDAGIRDIRAVSRRIWPIGKGRRLRRTRATGALAR